MTDATWLALTVVLTVVGAAVTWLVLKRRGSAPALRWAGITLLVPALYLTDALPLLVRIGSEIGTWATRLVLSPVVWSGVALGGVGVLLILAGGSLMARGRGLRAARPVDAVEGGSGGSARQVGAADPGRGARRPGGRGAPASPADRGSGRGSTGGSAGGSAGGDGGLDDDIEAILRKRGIT
ncbi:hypothetical protein GCM10009737_37390 [Nocardioides lentus]|uniref:Cellulose synthase n=1 Tax=Nocardioides lentus TaxID=338077 RepID=A0ABP5B7J4_9ACTN